MNINDDDILNIEFYHDNKDNFLLLKQCEYFYDTLNNKIINIITNFNNIEITNSNCENLLKETLFKNINYKNIILHKTYENEQNNLFNFDNVILTFDNGALTNTGINIMYNIFNIKLYTLKIYVPFIAIQIKFSTI